MIILPYFRQRKAIYSLSIFVKDISQKECRVYGIVVFLLSEGQQRLSLRCRKLKVLRYNSQRWLVMASPIFGVGKKKGT